MKDFSSEITHLVFWMKIKEPTSRTKTIISFVQIRLMSELAISGGGVNLIKILNIFDNNSVVLYKLVKKSRPSSAKADK